MRSTFSGSLGPAKALSRYTNECPECGARLREIKWNYLMGAPVRSRHFCACERCGSRFYYTEEYDIVNDDGPSAITWVSADGHVGLIGEAYTYNEPWDAEDLLDGMPSAREVIAAQDVAWILDYNPPFVIGKDGTIMTSSDVDEPYNLERFPDDARAEIARRLRAARDKWLRTHGGNASGSRRTVSKASAPKRKAASKPKSAACKPKVKAPAKSATKKTSAKKTPAKSAKAKTSGRR